MICPSCNTEIADGSLVCPYCAVQLQAPTVQAVETQASVVEMQPLSLPPVQEVAPELPAKGNGKAIASLVLGILSMVAWFIPLFGLPISTVGLTLGILARKSVRRKIALWGIVLSAFGLVLSLANGGYGVYLGTKKENNLVSSILDESKPTSTTIVAPAGYMRRGSSTFGYINIPTSWVQFKEAGGESTNMMQYSDKAGFSVVTVTPYGNTMTLAELTAEVSKYLDSSGTKATKTNAKVGEFAATKFTQNYTTEGKYMGTYVFDDGAGVKTISIEYSNTDTAGSTAAKEIVGSYAKDK